jgi:hypothetical protein
MGTFLIIADTLSKKEADELKRCTIETNFRLRKNIEKEAKKSNEKVLTKNIKDFSKIEGLEIEKY